MSASEITARLVDALTNAATQEAGGATALVSVTVDVLGGGEAGSVRTTLVRKTRTLVFMSAEFRTSAGERIATASSVHKLTT